MNASDQNTGFLVLSINRPLTMGLGNILLMNNVRKYSKLNIRKQLILTEFLPCTGYCFVGFHAD